jgi:pilus assembly protein CpaD
MSARDALRIASVFAVLLAGSCSSYDESSPVAGDAIASHPITVEPSYRSLKLAYTGSLSQDDSANLEAFVDDYLARGNGSISITAPAGPNAPQTISALGEQLAGMGVPRSQILVGVQDQGAPDSRVEFGYISYEARTKPCGDWSVDAADTASNLPMPNFGCSVQQNIAAQVANPRDLAEARPTVPGDATRRMQVLNKYEQAQTTSSQKTQQQSGAVSDVGGSTQ